MRLSTSTAVTALGATVFAGMVLMATVFPADEEANSEAKPDSDQDLASTTGPSRVPDQIPDANSTHRAYSDWVPSVSSVAVCGDGSRGGTEACDDGNTFPFDGCSPTCQAEPQCPVNGSCLSVCGDGVVANNEDCDDGNAADGDGCSSGCEVEAGFTCTQAVGETMSIPFVARDFEESHSDFEFPAEEPGDLAFGLVDPTPGLVATFLDSEKKPLFTGTEATTDIALMQNGLITSPTSFSEWYRNSSSASATVVSELVLYDDDGDGSYSNRYGSDGEKWERLNTEYEGNPVFFPLDGLGVTPASAYLVAQIPPLYFGLPEGADLDDLCELGCGCNPCWPIECVTGDSWMDGDCMFSVEDYACYANSPRHNFHFTTQAGFWFRYDSSVPHTLSFVGDDDVWVFLNGQLVLGMGGIHLPARDSVTFDSSLGLVDGMVYEVMVFHAERLSHTSTYNLTLSGFATAPSECQPI